MLLSVLLLQCAPDEGELVEVVVLPPTCLSTDLTALDDAYFAADCQAPSLGTVQSTPQPRKESVPVPSVDEV